MAIADFTAYESERKAPYQMLEITKDSTTLSAPGGWNSSWKTTPFAGVNPPTVTGENPTRATTGAIGQVNATGVQRLIQVALRTQNTHTLVLCDRLSHISGLDGTSTIAQLTAGMAVSRYTGAASKGNMLAVEIYTQIGATGTTYTCSYTDQDGNTAQTSQATAIGGTDFREVPRVLIAPLASGDSGVRDVASVTLAATTGTAGNFGLTIFRPLIMWPLTAHLTEQIIFDGVRQMGAFAPEILNNACLFFCGLTQSGTSGIRQITLRFIEE